MSRTRRSKQSWRPLRTAASVADGEVPGFAVGSDPQVMPQYGAPVVEPDRVFVGAGGVVGTGDAFGAEGVVVEGGVAAAGDDAVTIGEDVPAEGEASGAAGPPQAARAMTAAVAARTNDDGYLDNGYLMRPA